MFDPELFSQRIITAVKGFFNTEVLKLKLEMEKNADAIAQRGADAALAKLPAFMTKDAIESMVADLTSRYEQALTTIETMSAEIAELKAKPEPKVDVDYEKISGTVKELVVEAVTTIIAAMPPPQKGDDGVVDEVKLAEMVTFAVAERTKELAAPSIDYDQIFEVVRTELDARFKAIELPAPDKVDYDQVTATVSDLVKSAVAEIQVPEPEKVDYVRVAEEIAKAVSSIQLPTPDQVDYDRVGELVSELVKSAVDAVELPTPTGVDYDRVREDLDNLVKTYIAEIELPSFDEAKLLNDLQTKAFDHLMGLWKGMEFQQKVEQLELELKQRNQSEIDRVPTLIEQAVQTAIQQIELPAAKSVDPEEVLQMVVGQVRDYLGGMDLKPKEVDVDKLVLQAKEAVLESLPEPKPQEVRSLASAVIDDDGQLVLIFSDGQEKKLGTVRGRDGLSVEHFDVKVMPDGQHLEFSLKSHEGDVLFTHELFLPIPVYKQVYKAGETYTRGSVVTYGGSAWHAEKDAPVGAPGDHNSDWRLMVKKGRDFKQPVKAEAGK